MTSQGSINFYNGIVPSTDPSIDSSVEPVAQTQINPYLAGPAFYGTGSNANINIAFNNTSGIPIANFTSDPNRNLLISLQRWGNAINLFYQFNDQAIFPSQPDIGFPAGANTGVTVVTAKYGNNPTPAQILYGNLAYYWTNESFSSLLPITDPLIIADNFQNVMHQLFIKTTGLDALVGHGLTQAQLDQLADTSVSAYLANFPQSGNRIDTIDIVLGGSNANFDGSSPPATFYGLGPDVTTNFFQNYLNYISVANLGTYQNLYTQATGDLNQDNFNAVISKFLTDQLANSTMQVKFSGLTIPYNGLFNPPGALSDWLTKIGSKLTVFNINPITAGTGSEQARILFKILIILAEMIGRLQQLGATQAQQLEFFAKYQALYTNLATQIQVFTTGGQAWFSTDSSGDVNQRNQLNSSINASFNTRIQSYGNVVQDQQKRTQTQVNQTNDAANQQADMATSITQQLGSILQSLFKGG